MPLPRRPTPTLERKPWYTLGELALASGLSRRRVLKILRDANARVTPPRPTAGKRILVPLISLERSLPGFLEHLEGRGGDQ